MKINLNTVIISAVLIVCLIVSVTVFRTEISALLTSMAADNTGNTPGNQDNHTPMNPSVLGGSSAVNLPTELQNIGLEVHFIDIGQGDSIVIRLPDGKDVLIDAGSSTASGAAAVQEYLSYLSLINIDSFDYLIATHYDADHINMLDDVLSAYEVKNIYCNGSTHDSATYTKFAEACQNETGAVITYFDEDGDVYTLTGEGYSLDIYAPGFTRFTDANSMSPIVILEYAGRRVVLTGDAEEETESWFMTKTGLSSLDCDVIKLGHHGSDTSNSQAFLNFIAAEYAVVSVGETNSYNHPDPMVMNRLYNAGIVTYRTNRQGTIVLYVDGDGDFAFGVERQVPVENNKNLINDKMIVTPAE